MRVLKAGSNEVIRIFLGFDIPNKDQTYHVLSVGIDDIHVFFHTVPAGTCQSCTRPLMVVDLYLYDTVMDKLGLGV